MTTDSKQIQNSARSIDEEMVDIRTDAGMDISDLVDRSQGC